MFDNVGRTTDEEALRRGAVSGFFTATGLGAVAAFVIAIGTYTAVTQAPAEPPDLWVELAPEPEADPLLAPPPPPRGEPAAADTAPPDTQTEPQDVELDDHVIDEVRSAAPAAGDPDGVPGGPPGGVPNGVPGGGAPGVRAFHHSELSIRRKVDLEYPEAAESLSLGEQHCLATVQIDEQGIPTGVTVTGCPVLFHDEIRRSLLLWRWAPPRAGRETVRAQTVIAVTFRP